jgi:hypothetical protein
MREQGGGSTPYGYRVRRTTELVQVPEEQAVLWLIAHLRHNRGWSMPAIADELEKIGVRTRAGLPFSKQGLHIILRRMPAPAAEGLEDTG